MEPDTSIQLTFPMAAQEAITGDFEYIEPFHLLMAVLKFAEVDEDQLEEVAGDAEVAKMLLAERDRVRILLEERSIQVPGKTRPIRYGLRKHLRGGHPYDGRRVLHRSEASRLVCRRAEDAAHAANSRHWTAVHLVQALLESPSREIERALEAAGVPRTMPRPETPYLDRYGKDLSGLPTGKAGRSGTVDEVTKDPVCKVILDSYLSDQRRGLLLIQKGKRAPATIVGGLARYLISSSGLPPDKHRRVIEIDAAFGGWKGLARDPSHEEGMLAGILREEGESGDVILFFRTLHALLEPGLGRNCAELIKGWLSRGNFCIGGTDEENYRVWFEKDRSWKNLLRPIWIHDLDAPLRI